VMKGYVLSAREVTEPGDTCRKFEDARNLAFVHETSFLLTDAGYSYVQSHLAGTTALAPAGVDAVGRDVIMIPSVRPLWNRKSRVLYLGSRLVKQYRVLSPNQEAVLEAFQEEGWPPFIDDPLRPMPDQHPKQRLRETIRCLNANQKNHLLRFRGNGTGESVGWELVDDGISNLPVMQRQRRAA
jgi:hypothetical protein